MRWSLAAQAQVVCLAMFAVLAILFARQGAWAPALYYVGCIVKDTAVFLLAMLAADG